MKLTAVLRKVLFLEIFVMVIITILTFFISVFFIEPIRIIKFEGSKKCDVDYHDLKIILEFSLNDYNSLIEIMANFSLENSRSLIERYSSPEYYNNLVENGFNMKREEVHDFDTAVNIYKEIVKEFLPNTKEYENYRVFYDDSEKVWLIKGDFMSDRCYIKVMFPGVPGLLIRETGEILAIWYSE